MSKYTTELRYILENLSGLKESQGYSEIDIIIAKARPLVFSFQYPIFDPNHKVELETKILLHYYTREIGEETYGLWKLRLQTRMNEIMPYFNQLYATTTMITDPLQNYNYTETGKRHSTGNTTGTSNSVITDTGANTSMNAYSVTPEGSLNGVETLTYLTDARKITEDASNKTNQTANGTNTGTTDESNNLTRKGYQGLTQAEMLLTYRQTILNLDMEVIRSLEDLFMGIF